MGILSQIIIAILNIETLHSTIEVLWTLWDKHPRIRNAPEGSASSGALTAMPWVWQSLPQQSSYNTGGLNNWNRVPLKGSFKGFYIGYYKGSYEIGALIIRTGFGVHYTIIIIRNPQITRRSFNTPSIKS